MTTLSASKGVWLMSVISFAKAATAATGGPNRLSRRGRGTGVKVGGRIRHRREGGSVVVCHGLARLECGPTGRGLGRASARTPARPFTGKRSQRPRPWWSPVPTGRRMAGGLQIHFPRLLLMAAADAPGQSTRRKRLRDSGAGCHPLAHRWPFRGEDA
jgi:hypothetical protein